MACCSRISEPDSGQKTRYNLRGGQCCPPRILCAKGETAIGSASDCRKNSGERERAAALSRFNRGRHSSRATALCASATSPPESFGFQGGAAGACANAQWHRCVSMYGDHAADFSGRNPIFWKKNRFFTVFATGIACNSSKNCKAVAPLPKAGATSPGESFGFQPGAAETCAQAQRFRCVEGVVVAGEILPRPP